MPSVAPVEIRGVWSKIPSTNCKGLCTDQCTAIAMSEGEHAVLRQRIPSFPRVNEMISDLTEQREGYHCPALTFGRCIVYEDRPTICRLYGAVDHQLLRCPHGCEPDEGLLTHARASEIMDEARSVGGPTAS